MKYEKITVEKIKSELNPGYHLRAVDDHGEIHDLIFPRFDLICYWIEENVDLNGLHVTLTIEIIS